MSRTAWAYIYSIFLVGAGLCWLAASSPIAPLGEWQTFTILIVLATFVQLFKTAAPNHQLHYPHLVFFFAGALLLHPLLFVLLVAIPHLIEWAKERLLDGPHLRSWYIQPFNIAGHIISGFAAIWCFNIVQANTSVFLTASPILAAIIAAGVYILINHVLVGQALVLALNISWRVSGVLQIESLLADFSMACLGYLVAMVWQWNHWMLIPALVPMALMQRALMIPQLKQEAQTDGKTGLWNARHFSNLFTTEMARSARFNRPLAVIMADLDLLRNINNTYGHLAGDAVLAGIGQIIRDNIREYDFAGRFGGEEFAIVLPEMEPAEAKILAERLRAAVEEATFEVRTSSTPIKTTMSLGVAYFPLDAVTPSDLIHEADLAVYQAKLKGRNCIVYASDVPHSVKLQQTQISVHDRLASPYTGSPAEQGAASSAPTNTPRAQQAAPLQTTPNTVLAVPVFQANKPPDPPPPPVMAANVQPEVQPTELPAQSSERPAPTPAADRTPNSLLINLFVGSVTAFAAILTLVSFVSFAEASLTTIGLLIMLAVVAELLQIDLYGPGTVSVSLAIIFASGLIAGVPGVACVSAAISIVHYYRRRPPIYKTAFNWAVHVLAGLAPVLTISALGFKLHVENLLVLAVPTVIAALAYYVIETGLIAMAISLSTGKNAVITWREQFQWLVSHYMVLCIMGLFLGIASTALGPLGVIVFTMPVLMMRFSQKQYVERTEDIVQELRRMNEELMLANREVIEANQTMQQLNEELFLTLSRIIDARDPYVGGHANKVADYAIAIAKNINMPAEHLEPLRQAGFLHDIGKIGISEQVLHKPAKLTDEEYEYIKTHAALGGEFVEMSRSLRHLKPFIRHHHERWDGKGYPDELKEEEIPLEARILAVCDSVEAMASDRPYRQGMSLDEIIAEVKRCAGTQFDPSVAAAFIRIAEAEREHLIVNSAHEVMRRQADHADPAHLLSGLPLQSKVDALS